jgi:hypothetical protein
MLSVDLGFRRDAVVIGPRFGLPWEGHPVELLVLRPDGLAASMANVRREALTLTLTVRSARCVVAVTQPRRRVSKLKLLKRFESHATHNFRPLSPIALRSLNCISAFLILQ